MSRKLHTKLPVRPHSINNMCQNARKHPVQQKGLKQEQIKKPQLRTISPLGIRRQNENNQNLIARPGNSYIDSAGCQHESLPEFFHKLVTPTQLKSIDEARDLRQHWQLWIDVSGGIRNQILPKRIFAVPDYKRGKHNLLSLSLKLVFREWNAVEVQHPPTRCIEAKPFVASEMLVSLKVPDYLVSSVSENRHILQTHSAIKLAQLVCSISGPGDEELSQLVNSVPLLHFECASGGHPPPRLFDISVFSTGVRCVRHMLLLM